MSHWQQPHRLYSYLSIIDVGRTGCLQYVFTILNFGSLFATGKKVEAIQIMTRRSSHLALRLRFASANARHVWEADIQDCKNPRFVFASIARIAFLICTVL